MGLLGAWLLKRGPKILLYVAAALALYLAYRWAYLNGYSAREHEVQHSLLQANRAALQQTDALLQQKQQLEKKNYETNLLRKAATAHAHSLGERLQHTIDASRATPSTEPTQCRESSARDGAILGEMEQAGRGLATEAERLRDKVTALQAEVQHYYQACKS